MMRKLKGSHVFYVLLCECGVKNNEMICGVFASKREAVEVRKEVDGCGAKHTIRKCNVTVELL